MILIGIGANLPAPDGATPLEAARRAAAGLDSLPGLRLRALSRWYLTDPIPPSGQPEYVNAVAVLQVELPNAEPEPSVLLATLQAIEAEAGRVRGEPNAPRTLDLDIIAMGGDGQLVRTAPDPVLPHPRAHLRAFVLAPLQDVAPGWIHPVLRRGVRDLLRDLPPQVVRVL
ncbi:MAG TPA: 2-amino-4-hydroxy-6-hydroxymethyldihydropteridine diphosphokinase [Acetobacteraceae bacterium]|jgi:2-amino-4-hydroxy-6-hydroxymethyldihydropteridine diphosphokinase|nr:2-amino-4-hydroxy-6-hydroxymethyldihydropteridine diphosphokinase [Acetobacteraceae bacterium]